MSLPEKHDPIYNIANLKLAAEENSDELTDLLPGEIAIDTMKANFVAAAANNPKIMECTRSSIVRAYFDACAVGLLPHTSFEEAYLIPYYNNRRKTYEVQFQVGFRGLVKLAYNAGFVKSIVSRLVHENDDFENAYGAGSRPGYIHLVEASGNRGPVKGVMVIVALMTGGEIWEFYPLEKLEELRGRSQSYKSAVKYGKVDKDEIWGNEHNTYEMYRKYVWTNLSKWLPKSGTRYEKAIEISNRDFRDDGYTDEDPEEALYRVIDESEEDAGPARPKTPRSQDNEFASLIAEAFMTDLYDQNEEMKEFAKLVLSQLKKRSNQIVRVFRPDDIFALSGSDQTKIMGILKRINKELKGSRAAPDRVLRFIRYCIDKEYVLARYKDVGAVRAEFVQNEVSPDMFANHDENSAPFLQDQDEA